MMCHKPEKRMAGLKVLLMLLLAFLATTQLFAQETKVSLDLKDVYLREAFRDIETQTGFTFLYSNNNVDVTKKVTISVSAVSLSQALDQALKGQNVSYIIEGKQIVLSPIQDDSSRAAPQKITVSGAIKDAATQETLPGVNIMIKGTTQGTSSDFDGKFRVEVSETEPILIFSFVGYNSQEVAVMGQSTINVLLEPESKRLDEVIVIGYGTERKALLTGSIATIDSKGLKDKPVPSIDGVMQGQVSGVQVTQNSGTPGGEMSVRIRGISSISGSSQPLYIIDGVPVITGNYGQVGYSGQGSSALSDLNPNDIESISILKDAASSSIYGARASNGIVMITTKRGKKQSSEINVNFYTGVQEVWKTLDMLDAKQWMEYRNDLAGATVFTQDQMDNITIDTDWQKVIFRTAPISNLEISTTGGTDKAKVFISGNYFDQKGILIGTDYQRLNGRVNVDNQISDKINIGTSIGLSYAKTNRVEGDQTLHGPLPNGISSPSIYPVYNEDGSYNQDGPYSNAVSIANEAINENFSYRTNSNIFLDYQILPSLSFSTKWGVDFLDFREHAYESVKTVQGAKYNGLGFETYRNVTNIVSNNYFEYLKSLGDHRMQVMVGYSFESYSSRSSFIRGQDFADVNLEYLNSAATIVSASSNAYDSGLRSFFGRANYNYKIPMS